VVGLRNRWRLEMSVSSEAQRAADVFQQHRDELGFVNTAQCEEKELFTVVRDGRTVGAALANHCVRKPQTTLYELAVLPKYRGNGIGTELVERLKRDTPHDKIVAKCPVDLPSNEFYNRTGWECTDTESGKNRDLNVWELQIESVDIITTGRPDLIKYAGKHGWLTGTRLDSLKAHEKADMDVQFIDLHWDNPDQDALLAACMRHRPKYAVAGDYDGENYDQINDFAESLRQFAENVIIVPHEPGEVEKVPEWAVVGYSTPTTYAGTEAPIWEYYGRDVHILGGRLNQIKTVADHLRNDIVSIDTNTHHKEAVKYGKYISQTPPQQNKITFTPKKSNAKRAYENSVLNMTYAFEQWGLI